MFSYKDKKTAKAVAEALREIRLNEANQSHTPDLLQYQSGVGDSFIVGNKWVTGNKENLSPGGEVYDNHIKNTNVGDLDFQNDLEKSRREIRVSSPDGNGRMTVRPNPDGSFDTVHTGLPRQDPPGGVERGDGTTRYMGPDSVNKALRKTLNTIGPRGDNYPSQLGEQDIPSDDQIEFRKAVGSNEDLENAINTITGNIPPIPNMRADQRSLEKHLQGKGKDSGVVHPKHQHRKLRPFNPGMVREEKYNSGDFLAKYVTSGKAGKDVLSPDKFNTNNPLQLIKYGLRARKFNSGSFLSKPVPGREIPGSTASPVDDPTGQFGRPGLPGGQTAQSTKDMTYGDLVADMKDPKNRNYPTIGRENIAADKKYLEDLYGPDVDKGYRKAEREYQQQYQKELDDRRNSTLSQNNIFPPDTRGPVEKAGDRINKYLGRGGSIYDSKGNKDLTTKRYSYY